MDLFGRTTIYTDAEEITRENVVPEVYNALTVHEENAEQIQYLYDYYRGKQPILERVKEIRPEICNTIVENRAQEIVDFKTGYLAGEPLQYISMTGDLETSDRVARLNRFMLTKSKASKDKALIEWDMICGTAYRLGLPAEEDELAEEGDAPFDLMTLDPRQTFVIYSSDIWHRPMAGVYFTTDADGLRTFTVYTKDKYFKLVESDDAQRNVPGYDAYIDSEEAYTLGVIPIIEYPANNAKLGSFETVITLLDAINTVDSNRLDGVEQFIQSLLVLINCYLPEDVTVADIMQSGMIELKSSGENKADLKLLSEQLNQTETQTLKDDMYRAVLTIVGMPSQASGSQSDSSNNGAVILRNGWSQAEARAKDSELMFKESERRFLRLILRICRDLSDLDIMVSDIDYRFTRRNYEDILTKSQVLTTMLGTDKIDPKLSFNACGLFTDPESAYLQSMAWYAAHGGTVSGVSENSDDGSDVSESPADVSDTADEEETAV